MGGFLKNYSNISHWDFIKKYVINGQIAATITTSTAPTKPPAIPAEALPIAAPATTPARITIKTDTTALTPAAMHINLKPNFFIWNIISTQE